MEKVFLALASGQVFEGKRFGANVDAVGELVFSTGMGGYVEGLTDPSFYGQVVVQTFPMIGNYGFMKEDMESRKSFLNGYVVREWCEKPSNFRSEMDVDTYLKEQGIPGIYGVDTRQLTKIIREQGVVGAKITNEVTPALIEELKHFTIENAVANVSITKEEVYKAKGKKKYSVVMIDYGYKKNIARDLQSFGCEVCVVPHNTPAQDILAKKPDGVMLSNGPGNPEDNLFEVEQIGKLMGKVPMFGICLGHQILALANGGRTEKMKYGHRGANQPVKDIKTGKVYIASQNHGYTVVPESIKTGELRFVNANDDTCEGIDYPGLATFSVQFHPEACAGPKDTRFLFERFIANMEGAK